MKKTFLFVVAFVMLLINGTLNAQTSHNPTFRTGTVVIRVTNINLEKEPNVKIGLYNESSEFPVLGRETFGKNIKASKSVITHTFKNIPVGSYGAAVIQDENNDGILNKNFFGAPTELYGFSQNKFGFFGPPDYKDVTFEVEQDKTVSLTINLEK